MRIFTCTLNRYTMSKQFTYIKADALVPVSIGAGYLERLQKLALYILENKSDEELEQFKKNVAAGTVDEDSWEFHYETVGMLIKTIELVAVDMNFTTIENVDLTAKGD